MQVFQATTYLSSKTIPDLTNKVIRPDDRQHCAAGGFGDVFRCRYTNNDGIHEVAVKAFRFNFSVDDSERNKQDGEKAARMIRRELGIWRRLKHRNVVPFLGIAYGFGIQGSASLVSVWMPNGTLHTYMETHDGQLSVTRRLELLLDIANGLHYLHSFPMSHGDLTSNNVLLDHNYNACLTDFGCATLIGELPEGLTYLRMSTLRPGTLRWAAPEQLFPDEKGVKDTIKSDVYSLGNMALLVLSGKQPWCEVRADPAVVLKLSQGSKPDRPHERAIDDEHWALIERCWSSIPERPPVGDVVSSLQKFLGTHPSPPPLREHLDVPTPTSSVPIHLANDDPGRDVTQNGPKGIVAYRYNKELVYVPVAPDYNALLYACDAFPQLRRMHNASISLSLSTSGRPSRTVGISAPAWSKLIGSLAQYQIIDVQVTQANKTLVPIPDITITHADADTDDVGELGHAPLDRGPDIVVDDAVSSPQTMSTSTKQRKRSWLFQKLRGL